MTIEEVMMETDETENVSEFTFSEVLEMENLYKKRGDELQQQEHCEELATNFSRSDKRNGKSTVSWEQANKDHALYSDAHVIKIERQMHDRDNCTCTFMVRFEYDDAEMAKLPEKEQDSKPSSK